MWMGTYERMNWPKTMEQLVKHRNRPLISGRPFSPIQTGAITRTIPNPIARNVSTSSELNVRGRLTVD